MPNVYRNDPPEDFQALLDIWQSIRASADDAKDAGVSYFDHALSTGSWAWDPIFEHREPASIDRLGEVLLGPVFTSEDHPWPDDDGVPCIPLLQLDLDKASEMGGVDLGQGLLQVFVSVDDHRGQSIYTRTIDRCDVRLDALLPVPEFPSGIEAFATVDWANADAQEQSCIQIVDYAPKRFCFSGASDLSEWFKFDHFSDDVKAKMQRFEAILQNRRDDWDAGGFHLLGTFTPIQYNQAERDWPLFCLESEHGLNFADGHGQVFFGTAKSGNRVFYFDWSCF